MVGWIKQSLTAAAGSSPFAAFVALMESFGDRRRNLIRVLTYHAVDEPETADLYPGVLSATPSGFARQMEHLARRYCVVSLDRAMEAIQGGRPLPPRSVLVTFDDAYDNFAEHAWPVLKSLELPVTLFVPTAFPDSPEGSFWWDRLYRAVRNAGPFEQVETPLGPLRLLTDADRTASLKQAASRVKQLPHEEAMEAVQRVCKLLDAPALKNRVLGWDVLKQLAVEGVTMAPHTRTHPLMNRISLDRAREEAIGSLDDLRSRIDHVPPVLAYPGGAVSDETAKMLQDEGFLAALTTCRGVNLLPSADRFQLRRINVGRRTNLAVMRAQLLPQAVYWNKLLAISG